jgi:hypothetical protein
MKIKTAELSGLALDWAVAIITRPAVDGLDRTGLRLTSGGVYSPSTDWNQAGPIMDREGIGFRRNGKRTFSDDAMRYEANVICNQDDAPICRVGFRGTGPTALVAAMRCFVASKLGDEVEVPDELLTASEVASESAAPEPTLSPQRPRGG